MLTHAEIDGVLDQVSRGNRDGFRLIVRAFSLPLRCYIASQVHYPNDVEDITQEVFLSAYRQLGTFRRGDDFGKPSSSFVNSATNASGASGTASPQIDYNNCLATGGVTPNNVLCTTCGDWPVGSAWWWGRSSQTRYNHVMTPNTYNCAFGGDNGDSDDDAITASSRHPGGVNAAICDGSVRFIKSSISPPVWWALSTVAGGEVLDASSY
jgi:prepilin-type processing-associated H-X9-DG protein